MVPACWFFDLGVCHARNDPRAGGGHSGIVPCRAAPEPPADSGELSSLLASSPGRFLPTAYPQMVRSTSLPSASRASSSLGRVCRSRCGRGGLGGGNGRASTEVHLAQSSTQQGFLTSQDLRIIGLAWLAALCFDNGRRPWPSAKVVDRWQLMATHRSPNSGANADQRRQANVAEEVGPTSDCHVRTHAAARAFDIHRSVRHRMSPVARLPVAPGIRCTASFLLGRVVAQRIREVPVRDELRPAGADRMLDESCEQATPVSAT